MSYWFGFGYNYQGLLGIRNDKEIREIKELEVVPDEHIQQVISTAKSTLFLTKTGSIYSINYAGSPNETVLQKFETDPIRKIDYGNSHFIALTDDNIVYTWGSGSVGQLGHGDKFKRDQPEKLLFFQQKNVVDAFAIHSTSYVLLKSGELYGFGNGYYGELGNKKNYSSLKPTNIQRNIKTLITGSGHHVYGRWKNGDVKGWGFNEKGQLGIGSKKNQLTPVKNKFLSKKKIRDIHLGTDFTFAITNTGQLFSTGAVKNNGQAKELTNFKEIPNFKRANISDLTIGNDYTIVLTDESILFGFGTRMENYEDRSQIIQRIPYRVERSSKILEMTAGHNYSLYLKLNMPSSYVSIKTRSTQNSNTNNANTNINTNNTNINNDNNQYSETNMNIKQQQQQQQQQQFQKKNIQQKKLESVNNQNISTNTNSQPEKQEILSNTSTKEELRRRQIEKFRKLAMSGSNTNIQENNNEINNYNQNQQSNQEQFRNVNRSNNLDQFRNENQLRNQSQNQNQNQNYSQKNNISIINNQQNNTLLNKQNNENEKKITMETLNKYLTNQEFSQNIQHIEEREKIIIDGLSDLKTQINDNQFKITEIIQRNHESNNQLNTIKDTVGQCHLNFQDFKLDFNNNNNNKKNPLLNSSNSSTSLLLNDHIKNLEKKYGELDEIMNDQSFIFENLEDDIQKITKNIIDKDTEMKEMKELNSIFENCITIFQEQLKNQETELNKVKELVVRLSKK
ncbi:regulator of chromosome condensation (rcc1) family with fyve zinc finger domain-containing protein [Anaeramoeba flamelloides]|uniref:Regulator of chromosome condensation (Rcc1) family with fyve zinc finger domain-containing protein n=1 Tax=Anaeramoeba flamelloides TaxID=1746091 RepID=A0AAV8AF04_9EUKA|nr:regulator of chromosome condensation (rcc1) family with fyve zinc finger domain-containing protein [Anaeramoeba flamelloides]